MNKVTITTNDDNSLIAYHQNGKDGTVRTITGENLAKFFYVLLNMDVKTINKGNFKVVKHPFSKAKLYNNSNDEIVYVDKKHNIRIDNSPATLKALTKLKKEYFDEINKEKVIKVVNKVAEGLVGVYITADLIGGLVGGSLCETAGVPLKQLEVVNGIKYAAEHLKDATDDVKELIDKTEEVDIEEGINFDNVEEVNYTATGTITPIEQNVESMGDAIKENVEEINNEITTPEIQAIVNAPIVQTDMNTVYDQGIEDSLVQYENDIKEASAKWGISESILHDIISQESSGGIKNHKDGISQIKFGSWADVPIKIHNYITNEDEIVVFTNTPQKYEGLVNVVYTEQQLSYKNDTKAQIEAAAAILQHYVSNVYNGNMIASINAYNWGQPKTDTVLRNAAQNMNITVKELLEDRANTEWAEEFGIKDKHTHHTYAENIFKHVSNEEQEETGLNDTYFMLYIDENGEIQTSSIQPQAIGKTK